MKDEVTDHLGKIIPNFWNNPWICEGCGWPYDYAEDHFIWIYKGEYRCPDIWSW